MPALYYALSYANTFNNAPTATNIALKPNVGPPGYSAILRVITSKNHIVAEAKAVNKYGLDVEIQFHSKRTINGVSSLSTGASKPTLANAIVECTNNKISP